MHLFSDSRSVLAAAFRGSLAVAVLLCVFSMGGEVERARGQIPNASIAEIAQKSDLIFVGTVEEQTSHYNENRTLIYTQSTLVETQEIHAEGAEQAGSEAVTVVSAGGTVGEIGFRVSGQLTLESGQRYLLFKHDDGGRYFNPVIGAGRGLFRILRDTETGTPYVLSATGEAVLGATPEQVITSDQAVREIQNGDVLWAEDTTESTRYTGLPSPENSAHEVHLHESEFPSRGMPMTLHAFVDFIREEALTATVENPVLRLDGTGSLYRQEGETLVEEPLPEGKTFVPGNETGEGQIAPKAQNLRACGFQKLQIGMEHYAPLKSELNTGRGIWDDFMHLYNTNSDDGSFGRNGDNEFIGYASQSRMRGAYNGFTWGGKLGITKYWYFGKKCTKIGESDVALNAAYKWTTSLSVARTNKNIWALQSTLMHELGHTWGHQDFIDEKYNYDEPTVMHSSYNQGGRVGGWGIHGPDAHIVRGLYDDQTSVKSITDVGVELYYAEGGLKKTKTQDASDSDASTFRPGEVMKLKGVTVENMSNSAKEIHVEFYLTKDRTVTTRDHEIGSYVWNSFRSGSWNEGDYTVTIPFHLRNSPGKYYVGARVWRPGPDDFPANNTAVLFDQVTVEPPLTISGTVTESGGSGIMGVSLDRILQGATGAEGTVQTDKNGNYTLEVPYKFSGTIEPRSEVFNFTPGQASFTDATNSQSNQDFTATRQFAFIRGTVTSARTGNPLANVTIRGLPGSPRTDSQGDYRVTVEEGFEYSFAPSKAGFNFSPARRTIDRLTQAETQDFTAREAYVAKSLWPQFQNDRGRAGERSGIGIISAGTVLTGGTGSDVRSAPALAPLGRVYVGSNDGSVYAFEEDLSQAWQFRTGGAVQSSPTVGTGGVLYVGSSDGRLYALRRNGTLAWTFQTQDDVDASPVIGYDGTIYVGSDDDSLYAVRPNGTKQWAFGTGGDVATPALGPDSNRVYVGSSDGTFYALTTSGTKQWSVSIGTAITTAPAVAQDGNVYVGAHDSNLYAIRPDGTERWTYSTGGMIESAPALGLNQRIYVGSDDNQLHAVDSSGTRAWLASTGGDVRSSPAVQTYSDSQGNFKGEMVYVGSSDGTVYGFQGTSNNLASAGTKVWSHQTGDAILSSPALTEGLIFIGSDDDKLYSLGHPSPGTGPPIGRSAQLQAIAAAMIPSPEEIYVMNRIGRNALEVVDRFGGPGWVGGGCGGGPLIIPACGAGSPGGPGRYGGATPYRELVGGGLHRVGALAPSVTEEPEVLDAILAGETTEGLLGSFVHRFEPGTTSLAVLAGFSSPEEYPPNPNGRSTALNLFVKEGALAQSPDPELVQVMAGHFVPDAPGMQISLQGLDEPLGTLRYGDMTDYRALPPGQYVAVLTMLPEPASRTEKVENDGTTLSFPLDLTGMAGETVALLANGALKAPDEPPISIRAVGSDGEMSDLRKMEGTLAPGLSSLPGLLEDDLLLDPGETERVRFEPQFRTAGLRWTAEDVMRLLPMLSAANGFIREATSVDLPASYEIPASALSFGSAERAANRAEMRGQPVSEMPDPMADLISSNEQLRATHLGVIETSRPSGSVRFWLAMRTIRDYAVPVASLLQVEGFEEIESATSILTGYIPEEIGLPQASISEERFQIAMSVDLRLQSSPGGRFQRVTEQPVLIGNEGKAVSVDRIAVGQPNGNTAYLEDPVHLRLDSLIFGIEGQRRPVRDCTYVAMNPSLAKSRVSPHHELAALWTGEEVEDGGLRIERGQVHGVGHAEREALEHASASEIVADGRVSFGQTGVDIVFTGTEGTGTVTVQKYGNRPRDAEGMMENVSQYRWVIDADRGLSVGPETAVRLDVSTLAGIEDPTQVTMYWRSTPGSGMFEELETAYNSDTNELVARTGHFSEFALGSNTEPLPLDLVRFDAIVREGGVSLTWGTASEAETAGFEVQRRSGATQIWKKAGFVESKEGGSTTSPLLYRYVDSDLPYEADSVSYRLRQVDNDGRGEVSKAVTVRREVDEVELRAPYPNPAQDQAIVRYAVPNRREVTLRLYDILGRRVRTIVDEHKKGRQKQQMDVSALSSGVYFLRLSTEGTTTQAQRLTITQ